MRKIALANNKGGGKTTTTVNLAASLGERGIHVLVVDLDPQASATTWLGGRESSVGLVEYSAGGLRVSELVKPSTAPGVDLIPASSSLVPSGEETENRTGLAIVRAFRRLPDFWDLVLVGRHQRSGTCRSRLSSRATTSSFPSRPTHSRCRAWRASLYRSSARGGT